jgi:hypothetical protein
MLVLVGDTLISDCVSEFQSGASFHTIRSNAPLAFSSKIELPVPGRPLIVYDNEPVLKLCAAAALSERMEVRL